MNPFSYVAADSADQALREVGAAGAVYLAGGTNLIDEMKLGVHLPQLVVDVNRLPLDKIETLPDGGLRIGATVRNSDLANHPRVLDEYPCLSQAILSGASPQLRNMATTAGNLLQRTRCTYYRDISYSACNKRTPGSGCSAINGFNRSHAVLGVSSQCIATHPSDMDVALVALDATVQLTSPAGNRSVAINDFYVPYGQDPARENVLQPGELVTSVDLPKQSWFGRSAYMKTRDRASYEFALASAAVAINKGSDGKIADVRIALGGIATKPWRAFAAEKVLRGQAPDDGLFAAAADAELAAAQAQTHNAFKIPLAKRVIVLTLQRVASMS